MKLDKKAVMVLLEENGWSQNELAKKLGITSGALSNALSGKRGAGRKMLSNMLRLFPTHNVTSLKICER